MSFLRPVLIGASLVLLAAPPAMAETGADGIYTAAQAARGKTAYLGACTACHGGELAGGEDSPALTGPAFLAKWGKLPVGALFGFINTQMPLGAPGSLGAPANADITAYILSSNGLPAGQKELPPDARALSAVIMTKP